MTSTLDELRARIAIEQVIVRYGNCLDRGEFDGLAALFAEDAEFHIDPDPGVESPLVGAAIRDSIEDRWREMNAVEQRRHVMSNIEIVELSSSAARVRTTLTIFAVARIPNSPVRLHGLGVYDDLLELQRGRWVFTKRRLYVDRRDYFAPGWVSAE